MLWVTTGLRVCLVEASFYHHTCCTWLMLGLSPHCLVRKSSSARSDCCVEAGIDSPGTVVGVEFSLPSCVRSAIG